MEELTHELLKSRIYYDAVSGAFHWRNEGPGRKAWDSYEFR